MTKDQSLMTKFAIAVVICLLPTLATAAAPKPNIIVILSDDMGFSDLGCYGGEIHTPNLDALAAGGVRFTQFYNTARCCPTRASLLTGLYPHQAGMGHMTSDTGHDGYRGQLNKQCVTIAEVLGSAGYSNYMCGKWHVTRFDDPEGDISGWPLQRGFHKYYGTIRGGGNFYDPTGLCRQNKYITPVNDKDYQPKTYYYTDAISDNAVRYLQQHQQDSPDKPFFLYVAYTAAHWPMHALEKDIAKYKGKYNAGYEPIRAARFARLKQMGLVSADITLTTEPDAWNKVEDKAWEARCMEVYAAMIDNMDAGIGRIVAKLKRDGTFDNTLILFMQDNGGCAELTGRQSNGDGPGNLKPFGPDELQPKVTPPMQTRDGRWVRTGPGVMPGPADTFIAYGRNWARVSNTPFREFKHWNHEGGISTPLIAHWPGGIAAKMAGKLYPDPAHLIDVMATCVDLTSATYPTEKDGQTIKPMEGQSLRPAFGGLPLTPKPRAIFWEHEANRAVREGDWKLVAKANEPWELYDLSVDRTEMTDLAADEPDRVRYLAAKWDAYAARANVLPLGGWKKGGATNTGLSPLARFELKAGDRLTKGQSPAFAGKAITITAKFDVQELKKGVLVSHGGTQNGYVLFLEKGKLTFLVRAAGETRSVATPNAISGEHSAVARLELDGKLSLQLDGKPVDTSEAGPSPTMPGEGLEIGRDSAGAIGPYKTPNEFTGKIESVTVELDGEK